MYRKGQIISLTALSLLTITLSYIGAACAAPTEPRKVAEISFVFSTNLGNVLHSNPSWDKQLLKIEQMVNGQLQEVKHTIQDYDGSDKRMRSRATSYIGNVLGSYYEKPAEKRIDIFHVILDNIRHMDGTLTLDGPSRSSQLVTLSGGRLTLSQAFFTDNRIPDWERAYEILHATFRATAPKTAQMFALGRRDRQTGVSPVRPLFGNARPAADETVVDSAWNKGFKKITDQPTGPKALLYSPDLIALMGYCFTNHGALPPA
ncbi:hypothetical protein CVT24_002338 [Panaeolus cyanescens]|uniref:Uncharacterized protein n=1 Tax=Panaeolus cyanescens TaxID=181874 RepID=A0A409WJK1_9AGAR|nr:hypothetical protein CVT24_002338 [Panaeolus cyanescens]